MQTRKLSGGERIPLIGFGTGDLVPDEVARRAVEAALDAGYRHIDTAKVYDNEIGIGEAIKNSKLRRDKLFITAKLWNTDQGYDATMRAFDESLNRLGVEYLDLYLINWPATQRRNESWRAMVELKRQRLVRSIGVSNYTIRHFEDLLTTTSVIPEVNQIELHPYIFAEQRAILNFCQKHNILVEAYSPLSTAIKIASPDIIHIAERYGVSLNQVALRWCVQHGVIPLPRSVNVHHMRSNLEIFDFVLSSSDMHLLDSISTGERVTWDPATMR